MLDFNKTNKKALTDDIIKNATVLLTIHILTKQQYAQQLFDKDSLYQIAFFLAGLVVYHVIVSNALTQ
jgi:hypothetical protein